MDDLLLCFFVRGSGDGVGGGVLLGVTIEGIERNPVLPFFPFFFRLTEKNNLKSEKR